MKKTRGTTYHHVLISSFILICLPGVFTEGCVPMKNCLPPSCRCRQNEAPTTEPTENIPQMVLFTFDDAVRKQDLLWYKKLFSPVRKNPNGCPICMTLFLQDKYTDYKAVRELNHYGMEIAVHSVSHRLPSSFWSHISRNDFANEACKQKQNIHEKAGVPLDSIKGWRSPYLQPSGETQYSVLKDCNFTYDSTLTILKSQLALDSPWPFTLDFGWNLPCGVPPCPTGSYPGFWVLPVVSLVTSRKTPAVYVDAFRPNSVQEGYEFLWTNFHSYYTKKKVPFMLNMHSAWFNFPHNLEAMDKFILKLITLPDVYIVTSQQALDWMKNPVSLSNVSKLPSWGCPELNPVPRVTTLQSTTATTLNTSVTPTTSLRTKPVTVAPVSSLSTVAQNKAGLPVSPAHTLTPVTKTQRKPSTRVSASSTPSLTTAKPLPEAATYSSTIPRSSWSTPEVSVTEPVSVFSTVFPSYTASPKVTLPSTTGRPETKSALLGTSTQGFRKPSANTAVSGGVPSTPSISSPVHAVKPSSSLFTEPTVQTTTAISTTISKATTFSTTSNEWTSDQDTSATRSSSKMPQTTATPVELTSTPLELTTQEHSMGSSTHGGLQATDVTYKSTTTQERRSSTTGSSPASTQPSTMTPSIIMNPSSTQMTRTADLKPSVKETTLSHTVFPSNVTPITSTDEGDTPDVHSQTPVQRTPESMSPGGVASKPSSTTPILLTKIVHREEDMAPKQIDSSCAGLACSTALYTVLVMCIASL